MDKIKIMNKLIIKIVQMKWCKLALGNIITGICFLAKS